MMRTNLEQGMKHWIKRRRRLLHCWQTTERGERRYYLRSTQRAWRDWQTMRKAMLKKEQLLMKKGMCVAQQLLSSKKHRFLQFWLSSLHLMLDRQERREAAFMWMQDRSRALHYWSWKALMEENRAHFQDAEDRHLERYKHSVLRRIVAARLYGGNATLFFIVWKKIAYHERKKQTSIH